MNTEPPSAPLSYGQLASVSAGSVALYTLLPCIGRVIDAIATFITELAKHLH